MPDSVPSPYLTGVFDSYDGRVEAAQGLGSGLAGVFGGGDGGNRGTLRSYTSSYGWYHRPTKSSASSGKGKP